MKNLIFILVSISVLSINGFSQQDPKAREVLDKVSAKINSYSSFKVDYHYKYEDVKTGDESEEDGVAYIKGDYYKVELESYEVYYNGESLYTYVKGRNEVTIIKPITEGVNLDFTNPKQLFQFWNDDFKYSYIGDELLEGKTLMRIDLFPFEASKSSYSKITMLVDSKFNQIYFIKVFGKDGTRFSFTIKNLTENLDISQGKFSFNKDNYPGVEVIDLRF